MNFYSISSPLFLFTKRSRRSGGNSRKWKSKLVTVSSLSLSLVLSFHRAHDKGACREISRCKWVVTDPPQCRTNLKDHFPARPYFTSERCETRRDEREPWWWIGGPHTRRATGAACASSGCNFGSASWFTLVRNFDRALRSPSTIPREFRD